MAEGGSPPGGGGRGPQEYPPSRIPEPEVEEREKGERDKATIRSSSRESFLRRTNIDGKYVNLLLPAERAQPICRVF